MSTIEMNELLVPQDGDGIEVCGVYHDEPKRFFLQKGEDDGEKRLVIDADTGDVVMMLSHDVTAVSPFQSFIIKTKKHTMHGRQYLTLSESGETVMNLGKMSMLRTKHKLSPRFVVGREKKDETVYTCVPSMRRRNVSITNQKGELVAEMAKKKKGMIKKVLFGSESETAIDIAPGVDCSTILMIMLGLKKVGNSYSKDRKSRKKEKEAAAGEWLKVQVKEEIKDNVKEEIKDELLETIETEFGEVEGVPELLDAVEAAEGGLEVSEAVEGLAEVAEAVETVGELADAAGTLQDVVGLLSMF